MRQEIPAGRTFVAIRERIARWIGNLHRERQPTTNDLGLRSTLIAMIAATVGAGLFTVSKEV